MKQAELSELGTLSAMRDRFRASEDHESLNRIRAEDALRFYWGEQWKDAIEDARNKEGRPCFTLNKLPSILKQVLNEVQARRPSIQISPVSDGASEDTAEALQGLTRHIENRGEGADVAYFAAFELMVICGFASWRILTEYLPKSFNQDLLIERIPNPFSVYWDPAAVKLDKSDARYCFVTTDLTADAFKEQFPDSELAGLSDFAGIGDQAPGWLSKEGARVVEYFTMEQEPVELLQLADGSTCYEDELPEGARIAKGSDGKPVSRMDTRPCCYVQKSNGVEWLGDEKKKKLPGGAIPIITITGDQFIIDGELRIKGMVFDLEQPQRLFNYNSSAIAETMALGSKANWVATIEQIEPFMSIWQQSNVRNMAVLPYKNIVGVNPPTKVATEPPIQAMSAARLQSADDLRSISGVYDATQSPNGGEESGKAILARRRQTSSGNSNWKANLARGIKRTAQIILKYVPVIYDVPRVFRILGQDQQPQQIIVHSGQPEGVPALQTNPDKLASVFDLSAGEYEVTIDVGDAETKRQESVEMLLTLAAANPAIVPIIGDLIVQEMDFSGKKAIVARLQKALPPNLQDNSNNPTDPQQLQAHNAMLMQQNQQLMQHVAQITQVLQTKQIEAAGRLQVETLKANSSIQTAQARLEAERVKAQADILVHSADKQLEVVHSHALADKAHTHKTLQMQQANQHAADMASQAHANAGELAAMNPPTEKAA